MAPKKQEPGRTGPLTPAPLAVLQRFGEMVCLDDIGSVQVGDGSSQLEDAVKGTGSEMELLHGGP